MKPKIVLIGGGGHCVSCIDVIEQENRFEIFGILDEVDRSRKELMGYPILGGDDELKSLRLSIRFAFITVGQILCPSPRIRLFDYAMSLGYTLPIIVSPRAYVSKNALIKQGTIIMHDTLINSRASIGRNCIINTKALIEHDALVKNHCHISTSAILNGGVVVGTGSFIGSGCAIKEGVSIGNNCVVGIGLNVRHSLTDNVRFTGYNKV